MYKLDLEKAEEPEIIEKARELHKNIYFCFIDYAKAFDCVDHNKLWKISQKQHWNHAQKEDFKLPLVFIKAGHSKSRSVQSF